MKIVTDITLVPYHYHYDDKDVWISQDEFNRGPGRSIELRALHSRFGAYAGELRARYHPDIDGTPEDLINQAEHLLARANAANAARISALSALSARPAHIDTPTRRVRSTTR